MPEPHPSPVQVSLKYDDSGDLTMLFKQLEDLFEVNDVPTDQELKLL